MTPDIEVNERRIKDFDDLVLVRLGDTALARLKDGKVLQVELEEILIVIFHSPEVEDVEVE